MWITHYHQIQQRKPLPSYFKTFHQIKVLIGKKQDGHTQGIEISVMADVDITISIWDLVGQKEFHAFHDYMMPNLGSVVNLFSFLLVFDPIIHK